jgi:hypothetical protein
VELTLQSETGRSTWKNSAKLYAVWRAGCDGCQRRQRRAIVRPGDTRSHAARFDPLSMLTQRVGAASSLVVMLKRGMMTR